MAAANKRDDLDLHINLLAEHELAKPIELVARIAAKLDIDPRGDADIEDNQGCAAEAVMGALDQAGKADATRKRRLRVASMLMPDLVTLAEGRNNT